MFGSQVHFTEGDVDIGAGTGYPSSALSNFSPPPFTLDGVLCASMEGFLRGLKLKDPDVQEQVCSLVGREAKFRGKHKNWKVKGVLFWRGVIYDRYGPAYQELLDRAYKEMFTQSEGFRRALSATGVASLTHSIGKRREADTVLTQSEFCSRLTRLRDCFSYR